MAAPPSTSDTQRRPRPTDPEWVSGKLLRHGEDHYRFDPNNTKSYFVQLLTRETAQGAQNRRDHQDRSAMPIDGREETLPVTRDSGGVRTIWGWDLKRAVRESQSHVKVGDEVALHVVDTQPVQDEKGGVQPGKIKKIYEVERLSFVRVRNTNARKIREDYREGLQISADDPEGRQLYMLQRALEKLAELRYRSPEDRQRFVDGVLRAVDQSPDRAALIAAAARKAQDRNNRGPESNASKKPTHPSGRDPLTQE